MSKKSTEPGLSAAERKTLGGTKRKRQSPTIKRLRRHSMKIGSAYGKNAWFESELGAG